MLFMYHFKMWIRKIKYFCLDKTNLNFYFAGCEILIHTLFLVDTESESQVSFQF